MFRRVLVAAPTALLFAVLAAGVVAAHDGHDHPSPPAQVELRGRIVETHGDTLNGAPNGRAYHLETTTGERVRLDVGSKRLTPGERVRVRGSRTGTGGTLLVADGGSAVTADGPVGVNAIGTASTKKVAVIAFNFSNNTLQPWTTSQIAATFFGTSSSVRAYFSDASYGQLTVTGDVFGYYTIDATDQTCAATSTWASQARAAATNAGVNLAAYNHVAFIFPKSSACGWAGLAYMPGTESWNNGTLSVRVAGHELAHNFGVHHAASYSCTSGGVRVTLSTTCTESEYGDPFDIMGASSRLTNNWHRWRLGYFTSTEVTTVTQANPGQFTLGVVSQATSTPKIVRVARGDGTYYYLEFRQPFGTFDAFGSTDPAVNGVLIRIAKHFENVKPQLLDGTPSTTSFSDAAFGAGRTFTDSARGISISVVSVTTSGAVVQVSFGPDTTAPSAPGAATATTTETSVSLSWGAATDDTGVAGYRVRRDGVQIADQVGRTLTDTGRTPGTTHRYEIVAYDAAGNVGVPTTVEATTRWADTTAPTAPGSLSATAKTETSIALAWSAATDNVGVTGYRISRNGVVLATVTKLAYTDTGLLPGRTYTYTVEARDAAGNHGPAATTTATTKARKSRQTAPVTAPAPTGDRTGARSGSN